MKRKGLLMAAALAMMSAGPAYAMSIGRSNHDFHTHFVGDTSTTTGQGCWVKVDNKMTEAWSCPRNFKEQRTAWMSLVQTTAESSGNGTFEVRVQMAARTNVNAQAYGSPTAMTEVFGVFSGLYLSLRVDGMTVPGS